MTSGSIKGRGASQQLVEGKGLGDVAGEVEAPFDRRGRSGHTTGDDVGPRLGAHPDAHVALRRVRRWFVAELTPTERHEPVAIVDARDGETDPRLLDACQRLLIDEPRQDHEDWFGCDAFDTCELRAELHDRVVAGVRRGFLRVELTRLRRGVDVALVLQDAEL